MFRDAFFDLPNNVSSVVLSTFSDVDMSFAFVSSKEKKNFGNKEPVRCFYFCLFVFVVCFSLQRKIILCSPVRQHFFSFFIAHAVV